MTFKNWIGLVGSSGNQTIYLFGKNLKNRWFNYKNRQLKGNQVIFQFFDQTDF